jgi:hypothetical protein
MANLVMEVDVQPSHLGSSLHGCRFGFLLLKKNILGASPTVFLSKKLILHLFKEKNILDGVVILHETTRVTLEKT